MATTENEEPHALRRTQLLRSHPELKSMMKSEPLGKYICVFIVVSQIYLSIITRNLTGWRYFLVLYMCGGTLAQALFLGIHELTHNLFFKKTHSNRMFAMFCNFPTVIPFCEAFRFYHLQHHKGQGKEHDTDIPSNFEVNLFKGCVGKAIWFNFQLVAYAIRPMFIKALPFTHYLMCNIVFQVVFNVLLCMTYGYQPFVFLILSLLIAGGFGFHPTSAHFISEHYLMHDNNSQETFSYYGWLNYLTFNVGYHVEHHDLSNIPFTKLPQVREIAPEFYESLSVCDSWVALPFCFVMNDKISLNSRMKRNT